MRGVSAGRHRTGSRDRRASYSIVFALLLSVGSSAQSPEVAAITLRRATLASLPRRTALGAPLVRVSDDSVDFGKIAGGCLSADGAAVVLSTAPSKLLVVRARGVPALRMMGKGGSGPGELQQPWAISCFAQDSVAVLELARVTVADVSDSSFRSFAIQPVLSGRWLEVIARLANGKYLLRSRDIARALVTGTNRDTVDLLVASGLLENRPRSQLILRSAGDEFVRITHGRGVTTAIHPFGRALLIAAGDTCIYSMDTGTDELYVRALDGRVTQRVRIQSAPRRLEGSVVRRARQRRLAATHSTEERELAEMLHGNTSIPSVLPRFDKMVALGTGGVLLREFLLDGEPVARWLELDRTLTPRAYWQLPPELRVLAADSAGLLGLLTEGDASVLVRMVIGPAPH